MDINTSGLSNKQKAHVEEIARTFCTMMAAKYAQGQLEHGGDLWDMPSDRLLDNAIYEAIDQVVYLLTLRQKLGRKEGLHGNS